MNQLVDPFLKFDVRYHVTGGTKVEWWLDEKFTDILPHSFQLQGAHGSTQTADWKNIGLAANNVYFLVDDEQRVWGKTQDWLYRVVLTTPSGVYTSRPIAVADNLDHRSWRLSDDMIRKERLLLSEFSGINCYFLKRKRYGAPCPDCTDALTKEVTNSNCTTCSGTGILGGYFAAVPDVYVMMPPPQVQEQMDALQNAGTTKPVVVEGARALGFPAMDAFDILIDAKTDERYVVRSIQSVALVRNYPVATSLTIRLLPFSDYAYQIPLEGN